MVASLLTICIPTFNRSAKLDKQLNRLIDLITASSTIANVGIHVSDNGSTDHTQKVILKHQRRFKALSIPFTHFKHEENLGFDCNIYSCYNFILSSYIWFLSDDDIPHPKSITKILSDISKKPNLIVYNFFQEPYISSNPYYNDYFLQQISNSNSNFLIKLASWPKLSSLVIKKFPLDPFLSELQLPFAHTVISTYVSLIYGSIITSRFFIASVDIDYMDSVDFPPYVGNAIKPMLSTLYSYFDQPDLLNPVLRSFDKINVDLFYSSIGFLTINNSASVFISPSLKSQLFRVVKNELKDRPILYFSRAFFLYIVSFLYLFYPFVFLKRLRKSRRYSYNSRLLLHFLES